MGGGGHRRTHLLAEARPPPPPPFPGLPLNSESPNALDTASSPITCAGHCHHIRQSHRTPSTFNTIRSTTTAASNLACMVVVTRARCLVRRPLTLLTTPVHSTRTDPPFVSFDSFDHVVRLSLSFSFSSLTLGLTLVLSDSPFPLPSLSLSFPLLLYLPLTRRCATKPPARCTLSCSSAREGLWSFEAIRTLPPRHSTVRLSPTFAM